jgi:hypothetical protein
VQGRVAQAVLAVYTEAALDEALHDGYVARGGGGVQQRGATLQMMVMVMGDSNGDGDRDKIRKRKTQEEDGSQHEETKSEKCKN